MVEGNLYLRLRKLSHTIYAANFVQTIIHQHVHLLRESRSHEPEHVLMRLCTQSINRSFVNKAKEGRHVRITNNTDYQMHLGQHRNPLGTNSPPAQISICSSSSSSSSSSRNSTLTVVTFNGIPAYDLLDSGLFYNRQNS